MKLMTANFRVGSPAFWVEVVLSMYFCNAGINICVLYLDPCVHKGPAGYLLLILTGCAASKKGAPDHRQSETSSRSR